MDEAPRSGVAYRFVVQSVLSVVLADDFHRLEQRGQGFANRTNLRPEDWWVLHWHGRGQKPWTHKGMANADLWKSYFEDRHGL